MKQQIAELVDRLTSGCIKEPEREAVIDEVARASRALDWVTSDAQAYSVALTGALHGHSASGDPLNEVHDERRN